MYCRWLSIISSSSSLFNPTQPFFRIHSQTVSCKYISLKKIMCQSQWILQIRKNFAISFVFENREDRWAWKRAEKRETKNIWKCWNKFSFTLFCFKVQWQEICHQSAPPLKFLPKWFFCRIFDWFSYNHKHLLNSFLNYIVRRGNTNRNNFHCFN